MCDDFSGICEEPDETLPVSGVTERLKLTHSCVLKRSIGRSTTRKGIGHILPKKRWVGRHVETPSDEQALIEVDNETVFRAVVAPRDRG